MPSADFLDNLQVGVLFVAATIAVLAGGALAIMGWCSPELPRNATRWQRFKRALYEFL